VEREQIPNCLDTLFRLHQGRWQSVGQPGSFSSTERRSFYAHLSDYFLARGWLQLWALEVSGEIAAVQFAFRYKDRVFQLQEGYDHHRSSDRLGYVLRGEVLKTLIAEGVRVYDFLGGKDSYKTRWGAKLGYYRTLRFALPLTRGGLALQLATHAIAGKNWLRRNLPQPAWRFLKKVNIALNGRVSSPTPATSPIANAFGPGASC
jgi:CelD/BcsL family acetyltransferase involved in cellulose biosynthesis